MFIASSNPPLSSAPSVPDLAWRVPDLLWRQFPFPFSHISLSLFSFSFFFLFQFRRRSAPPAPPQPPGHPLVGKRSSSVPETVSNCVPKVRKWTKWWLILLGAYCEGFDF
jgi:hypothetical protein